MKVKELIAKLQKADGELDIIVQVRDLFDDVTGGQTCEELLEEFAEDGYPITRKQLGLPETKKYYILQKNNN